MITFPQAMRDPLLFGRSFEGPSWDAWEAIAKGAFALPMSDEELAIFAELSGGRAPPTRQVKEWWTDAGRRCGKDSVTAALIVWKACVEESHIGYLRPGERACVLCLATDREQAKIVKNYATAYFDEIPALRELIVGETQYGLRLSNGVDIEIATNSYRSTRGKTVLLAVFDEVATWRDETSATPDIETYRSILPGLSTIPGSMLIGISSPYRKAGLLWERHRKCFGHDDDRTLVIQASTLQLNPSFDPQVVADALADDPAAARAEYLGEFRDDIGGYIPIELIEGLVDVGVTVRPPRDGVRYFAFVDSAGGTGQDSFTLTIAHIGEGEMVVIDLIHEIRPPFNPQEAVFEVVHLARSYMVSKVVGDMYAPGFVSEAFERHGRGYEFSERNKSQIYVDALPYLTAGKVRLLDNRRSIVQLAGLERRTNSGGKDSIDHGRNSHDDVANAIAGAIVSAAGSAGDPGHWIALGNRIEAEGGVAHWFANRGIY
jgi:hypothetical protein